MIECLLVLQPVSVHTVYMDIFLFILLKFDMHTGHRPLFQYEGAWAFTHIQIHSLFIQLTAQVLHMVQQIMSAESMPVLSEAVPSFKIFMTWWEKLCTKYPELKP